MPEEEKKGSPSYMPGFFSKPLLWPLPALGVHMVNLVCAKSIWAPAMIDLWHSQREVVPAHLVIIMLLVLSALYFACEWLAGRGRAHTEPVPPPQKERSTVIWIVRVPVLLCLYITAIESLTRYR